MSMMAMHNGGSRSGLLIPYIRKQEFTLKFIIKYCSYHKKKMWSVFGLLFRTIKQTKELLIYCFTHLLYLSGPVNPIASIILVKAPTFSSDGSKESFAERCCKIEIAHILVSALKSDTF